MNVQDAMKSRLLASVAFLSAVAFCSVPLLYKSAVNDDATLVISMSVAKLVRQNGGRMPGTTAIDREIAHLIEANVIHGSVTDGVPSNVWGNPFTFEVVGDGIVHCRSPGLFGVLGSSEHTGDLR